MSTLPRWAKYRVNLDGSVTMRFSYVPALIQAFKDRIPASCRCYAPEDHKSWTFDATYADDAIILLLQYFPDAEIESTRRTRSNATTHPRPAGNDYFRVLHLRETAPVELIEASYRVLARLHHPDAGGSTETMMAINTAYAQLKERVHS